MCKQTLWTVGYRSNFSYNIALGSSITTSGRCLNHWWCGGGRRCRFLQHSGRLPPAARMSDWQCISSELVGPKCVSWFYRLAVLWQTIKCGFITFDCGCRFDLYCHNFPVVIRFACSQLLCFQSIYPLHPLLWTQTYSTHCMLYLKTASHPKTIEKWPKPSWGATWGLGYLLLVF